MSNSTTFNFEAEQKAKNATQTEGLHTPQKQKFSSENGELIVQSDLNEQKKFKSPRSSAKKFTPRIII